MRVSLRPLPLSLLVAASAAAAQPAPAAPRSTATAVRRDGPVLIDGRLDEGAWAKAPVFNRFTQSYPNVGRPDTTTFVRVLYDDDALYVGIRMLDAHPDSIAAQLARRDASGIYSDWVHLIIDSYHDRRTAFRGPPDTTLIRWSIASGRLLVLIDSTLADEHEHGSFVLTDTAAVLYLGPIIHGDTAKVIMAPPPPNACMAHHAHPKGAQWREGPSDGDYFFGSTYKIVQMVVTNDFVYFINTTNSARLLGRRKH